MLSFHLSRSRLWCAVIISLMFPGMVAYGQSPVASSSRPTLVVALVVDQMRADYLDRFAHQFTGGLARFGTGGAVFTHAFQDHGVTTTAPGHSTIMSGRFPVHTGIRSNDKGVPDDQVQLVGAPDAGASPKRFIGTTLSDWITNAFPQSRTLAISAKDRGAILMAGKGKQHQVFWYAESNGSFTTSTYYADTLPAWIRAFNARRGPQQYAGQSWYPLLHDTAAYPEPDSVPVENSGKEIVFPHRLSSDSAKAAKDFRDFPWMDRTLLALALEGVNALQLGRGQQTDVLTVSLSTTDAIGHTFGPDSREVHDQLLQLDRTLGEFIDSLYVLRDSAQIIFALTADHGVCPFPEVHNAATGDSARYVSVKNIAASVRASLAARGVDAARALEWSSGTIFIDRTLFAAAGIDADSTITALASTLRQLPGMLRVNMLTELAHADTVTDVIARRWLHMYQPTDSTVALLMTLAPYSYWGSPGSSAQHGSPHDYDAHVPIVFYGAGVRPGRYAEFARTVDVAPTLAAIIGVHPLAPLDGRVLEEVVKVR